MNVTYTGKDIHVTLWLARRLAMGRRMLRQGRNAQQFVDQTWESLLRWAA